MENIKQIDELISKELDTLENAISDENRALAICSREEIWKLILKRGDLAIAEGRKNTLKELIIEYQDNELEGKGYDFYFSIRTKLDNLITNSKK